MPEAWEEGFYFKWKKVPESVQLKLMKFKMEN